MKQLLRAVLLVAVLCLNGCSSEYPQSVELSTTSVIINHEQNLVGTDINANCPWTASTNSDGVRVFPTSGKGSFHLDVEVNENLSEKERTHVVLVASSDNTCRREFKIHQKGKPVLHAGLPEMFPAEGGTFEIPLNGNVEISRITSSPWAVVSSDGTVQPKSCTINLEPNQTGKIREVEVYFWVDNADDFLFTVTQDSYTPVSVTFEDFPSYSVNTGFWRTIFVEPEYADFSKLNVSCPERGSADIKNYNCLIVVMPEYGKYPVYIYTENDTLFHAVPECIPSSPFSGEYTSDAFIGQKSDLVDWKYHSSLYTLKSSDIAVVRVVDGNHFEAVGVGTAVISAGIPGTNVHSEKSVNVDHFILDAWVDHLNQQKDGSYDVVLAAKVKGPENLKILTAEITGPDGSYPFAFGNPAYDSEDDSYTLLSQMLNVNFDREKFGSIDYFLNGYNAEVSVSMEGSLYKRTHYMRAYSPDTF